MQPYPCITYLPPHDQSLPRTKRPALLARAQLFYLTNLITQPKGKEYVQDMCKTVYRICKLLHPLDKHSTILCLSSSRTVGPLGRLKLYHIKRQYDSSVKLDGKTVQPYAYTSGRVDRPTAMYYISEIARMCYSLPSPICPCSLLIMSL